MKLGLTGLIIGLMLMVDVTPGYAKGDPSDCTVDPRTNENDWVIFIGKAIQEAAKFEGWAEGGTLFEVESFELSPHSVQVLEEVPPPEINCKQLWEHRFDDCVRAAGGTYDCRLSKNTEVYESECGRKYSLRTKEFSGHHKVVISGGGAIMRSVRLGNTLKYYAAFEIGKRYWVQAKRETFPAGFHTWKIGDVAERWVIPSCPKPLVKEMTEHASSTPRK